MMYSVVKVCLVVLANCCLVQQALAVTLLKAHVCEGNYAWLECPVGSAIHVTKAHYGRTSTDVCVHEKGIKTDCVQTAAASTTSTNKVKAVCDNRQTCSVYASNYIYGDTCSGTYKYITVEYTCGAKECKNVYDDAKCDDYATGNWSKEKGNECLKNPTWMYPNCWKSCTGCKADCQNVDLDDAVCDKWALQGECMNNPTWMYAKCSRSCKSCPRSEVCENVAGDATCQGITGRNECNGNNLHNEFWMDRNCAKACHGCHRDCYDLYWNTTQCGVWAANGECKKNPTWMYAYCSKACGTCPAKGAVCANVDGDAACDAKRSEGKCHSEPETMLVNCQKSCRCFKGDECLNSYYVGWNCEYWAKNGECAKNPGWMNVNCKKSCNKCT